MKSKILFLALALAKAKGRVKHFVIRLFCLHSSWQLYPYWHSARKFGAEIYECKRCGKVKAVEPWKTPKNYGLRKTGDV